MDVQTGAATSLVYKLCSFVEHYKHELQRSTREDIKYLSSEMGILAATADRDLDRSSKVWADHIRELSYDIDNAIDDFLHTGNSEGAKGLMEKMGGFLKKRKTHQIFASTIKNIKDQVQIISESRPSSLFDSIEKPAALQVLFPEVKDLVGIRGKTDQDLMNLLSDGDNVSNKKLKIVSVVGFGGLGKTTLVKAVYDKIGRGFDCKAFVPTGKTVDVRKVLEDLLTQLTISNSYSNTCTINEQGLIEKVGEILEKKRYLIVIDDVGDENLWEIIKDAFSPNNNLGSRVIITTRIVSVSKACCSSGNDSIYQMKPLSDDDSKELLYAEIFGTASKCPYEFEQACIGILNKCGGVPIAIITMASILAGNQEMKAWHALLKSSGYEFKNEYWVNMEIIISFGYHGLPSHLKTCLLSMSTFPGGHPIERDRLVKKWIVEGTVRCSYMLTCTVDLEEMASGHLDELIKRNVVRPLECSNGEVITCHIHPMIHDILKAIAVKEKFAASLDVEHISRAHRMNWLNLSVHCPDSQNLTDLASIAFNGVARSLTVFGHASRFLLRHFDGIRGLDLEGCKSIERADVEYICSMVLLKRLCLAKTQITELPTQIGNLQCLEDLDVGGTQITQLPTEIGRLLHLKTLDARKSRVKVLPNQVVQLTRLIHLFAGDNESCVGVKLPDGIGKMTSLDKLGIIDLSKCSASSLKELGNHPRLRDIVVVVSDEPGDTRMNDDLLFTGLRPFMVDVCSDFRLSTLPKCSMINLNCRKKLTVVRTSLKVPDGIKDQAFAENRFLILRVLDIRVCKLKEYDLKLLRELPRLQSLVVRLEVLPKQMIRISCAGFAKLESFCVDCRMPRVMFKEGAMPKLEHLELKVYGGTASEEHMGINHLLNLQKVTLRYSKWYATNKGVRETTEAVKTECKDHQNEITLCIAEEEKKGICKMKTEIFQENRVASCSRTTEIEKEEEDTQEGDLNQSSHDIASCSGTSEIEEVVE